MIALACVPLILAAAPAAQINAPVAPTIVDTVAAPEQVDRSTQADDIRLRTDKNQRMTVPVSIAGTGPFRFLVDTAADTTAISGAVAARLGIKANESASLHSLTGVSRVRTATVRDLKISKSQLRSVDAPILDSEAMGADGILGTDSLRSQRVMFDFENQLMTIVPAAQPAPAEDGTIVVTGRLRNGRLIVTNAKADDTSVIVIIDTGAEVSIGNEALRRRLARQQKLVTGSRIAVQSVTGESLNGQQRYVKRLDMGDVDLKNLAVVFAPAHTFKLLGLEGRPALLLGMNALRAFKKVSIDFANKKLRIVLPESAGLNSVLFAER